MPHTELDSRGRIRCRHIYTGGSQCGSPALLKEQFCYYHHTNRRPPPPVGKFRHIDAYEPFTLPLVEDRASALAVAAHILSRIASNDLDPTRAGPMLFNLQIITACCLSRSPPQSCTRIRASAPPSRRRAPPRSSPRPHRSSQLRRHLIAELPASSRTGARAKHPAAARTPRRNFQRGCRHPKRSRGARPERGAAESNGTPASGFLQDVRPLHNLEPRTGNLEPTPLYPRSRSPGAP